MYPVLIHMRRRILETGVISLLTAADDVLAVRIPDSRTIKGDIIKMQPCVVILDADAHGDQTARVLQLLDTLPKLRVLLVRLESNVVEVYDKHEITLSDASDLINVIHRSGPVVSPVQT